MVIAVALWYLLFQQRITDCLEYASTVMHTGQTEHHTQPHTTNGLGSKHRNAQSVTLSTKKKNLHLKKWQFIWGWVEESSKQRVGKTVLQKVGIVAHAKDLR